MYKFTLIVLSLAITASLSAQSNIQLQITHHLNGVDFGFGTTAENNLENEFDLGRMQYYISEITIVHDGGLETAVPDHWILVSAASTTLEDLGALSITEVERIRFSVGVDPDHNHLDPSSYASGHPLAPQFPSMHWGWSAGYRFVAMEGNSSGQVFEIHALGDNYYFEVDQEVDAENIAGDLVIQIYADYTRAIEDIDVSTGIIVHGDFGQATDLLENFRDYVFSGVAPTPPVVSGINDLNFQEAVNVYPNPATAGVVYLTFPQELISTNTDLVVSDFSGKTLYTQHFAAGTTIHQFRIENSGPVIIHLFADGNAIARKMLIVE